jgi:serine/threonine protein kinase
MMSSATNARLTQPPTTIADLTDHQQQRLTQLLDDYLRGLEQGEPVDVQQMLCSNGDLENVLRAYLAKLDDLHGIAAGFQEHGELEPLVSGESGSQVKSLQLGEYTIIRELGRGGMGIVYEARQRTLDRRVALKLLPMASMLDARQIARFKNESYAAAQLQHPNIVPVHSVGVHRGIHFYAMQFIEGQTVDSWISSSVKPGSATQWWDTVRFAIDIADALHCAHECGIVHRDIKPSNLMLDQSGKAWVTDFGLARCQNDLSLTLSGDLVGTMRYMSPEQAGGRAELVDQRTDIYSLGATLYEMLTGEFAIKGDDGPTILSEIANGAPPRLRRVLRDVPSDLEVVVQKAMSKEKDDRYTTAREFADDLKAVLENRPTLAKPPSMTQLASRWASRHRKLVSAASLVFLLGIIGMVASVVFISEQNRTLKASYDFADMYFSKAQETVNQLGSRYADRLASVPGAERIRQSLQRDTLAYYQEFVAQATGDHQLRSELALTHSRIGVLIKELESAERSIPHFEKSAQVYREIVAESNSSPVLVRGMAQNMNQLGLALFAASRTIEAKVAYEQAIKLQHELVAQSDDVSLQTDLALTQSNLGLLLGQTGQVDMARAQLTVAVEHLTTATNQDDHDVLAGRGLAAALASLSSLSIDTDPGESIQLLELAIDHQLRITKDSPNRLKASSEIATTYDNLGGAYLGLGDPKKAAEAFTNAVKIQRRLHAIAPAVDRYRYDLAMCLNNLATALHKDGILRPAYDAANEAVSLQQTCLQHETPNAVSLSRLGVMFNNLGTSLEAMSETRRAAKAYQSAVDHQRSALTIDPETQQFQQYLLQHYSNLLRLQIDDQRWRDTESTGKAYRAAAMDQPAALLSVAEDMARLSMHAPAGARRERLVSDSAAAIVSARRAGMKLDSALLLREPFRSVAQIPGFRRAVQP